MNVDKFLSLAFGPPTESDHTKGDMNAMAEAYSSRPFLRLSHIGLRTQFPALYALLKGYERTTTGADTVGVINSLSAIYIFAQDNDCDMDAFQDTPAWDRAFNSVQETITDGATLMAMCEATPVMGDIREIMKDRNEELLIGMLYGVASAKLVLGNDISGPKAFEALYTDTEMPAQESPPDTEEAFGDSAAPVIEDQGEVPSSGLGTVQQLNELIHLFKQYGSMPGLTVSNTTGKITLTAYLKLPITGGVLLSVLSKLEPFIGIEGVENLVLNPINPSNSHGIYIEITL